MEEQFHKHIKEQILEIGNYKISFEQIYNGYENLEHIRIYNFENYKIATFGDCMTYIFFYTLYTVEVRVIRINPKKKNETITNIENIKICSNYELIKYCRDKDYRLPYIIVGKEKYTLDKAFDVGNNILNPIINGKENEKKLILIQDLSEFRYLNLKVLKIPANFNSQNYIFNPVDMSDYFELLFKNNNSTSLFTYYNSEIRQKLEIIVYCLLTSKDRSLLKLCGPSAIGKSMTLFLISKRINNIMYLNLKTMKELKEKSEYAKIYNLFLESLQYFTFKNEEEKSKLEKVLQELKGNEFLEILEKIVYYFIENNILSMIILDQYKEGNIDVKRYEKIEQNIKGLDKKNVKIILCASTNDKDIRQFLAKSWKIPEVRNHIFTKEFQDYFYYIASLYKKVNHQENCELFKEILNDFNYYPKYIIIFNKLEKKGEKKALKR